jgi:hypothetical protein
MLPSAAAFVALSSATAMSSAKLRMSTRLVQGHAIAKCDAHDRMYAVKYDFKMQSKD